MNPFAVLFVFVTLLGIKGGGSPINGAINGAEDENSLFHRVGDKDDGGSKDPSDNSYLEAEAKLMANGRQISPKLEYDSVKVPGDDKEMDEPSGIKGEGSPINGAINRAIDGAEDENSLIDRIGDRDDGGSKDPFNANPLKAEAKSLVNGQQIASKLEYDSVKVPGDGKEMDDSLKRRARMSPSTCIDSWWKYSEETQWCTGKGRSELYSDTDNPINVTECQRLCQEKRPGCDAVEFWEKYNYACFECTDRSKISPYTWTRDLAYPVYVWIYSVWTKYSTNTHWCTGAGRSELYSDEKNPITAAECQRICERKRPGCEAVEFWEKYNYACFECTDTSKISHYGWVRDLAYPVYVWIKL